MFKNRISIRVERDLVTFVKGPESVSLAPYICVDDESIILSVGEPPPPTRKSIRINLFEEPQVTRDYGEILAAFLRHGIAVLLHGGLFRLRPTIDFVVAPDVATFLRGYHKLVFSDVAIQAGAVHATVAIACT